MIKKLLTALLTVALILSSLLPAQAEKFTFKKGATSQTVYFRVFDSSSTAGGSLTGLTSNSPGLTCYYVRVLGSATQIPLAPQTVIGAYSSGGFVQVDATNMPGLYRLDLPDAVVATGVDRATVLCKGATNMVPVQVDVELVAYDPQAATNLGLSGLPTANPGANGGLPTTDANNAIKVQTGTGANQLDLTGGRIKSDLSHWNGTAVATPDTDGYPKVTIKDGTGVGEIDTASGKVSIASGGITPASFSTAGTISIEAGTTLSLSAGVAANDQFNYTHAIQVYGAADSALQASSCIVDTVNGTPDQVITMEDITAFIAVSDPFDIVPAPACATLRPTTPGNKVDVTPSGEVGIDLNNTAGTLDAAEIGAGSITNTKFASGAIDAAAIGTNAIGAAEIADGSVAGDVWGALRSAHVAAGTFGQEVSARIIRSGMAQAGAATTITLDAGASATNDLYLYATITILSGPGAGQTRQISGYNGTSKVATVNTIWAVAPASGSAFLLTAP